jgi:Grx4 family monothiol glutaredoxin
MTDLKSRIQGLVDSQPLFLFMKGNPTFPRCGFSNQVVQILRAFQVPFGHFDILSDEEMRQGVKEFADWPTFPQLFVKGELFGGCDIVREAMERGELLTALQAALPEQQIEAPKPPAATRHITPQEAATMLESRGDGLFLDVRSPEERACATIAGFVPLDQELAEKLLAEGNLDRPLVFLCHYGGRSAQAADYFVQRGFQRVFNVSGGIDEWSRSVDPTTARY